MNDINLGWLAGILEGEGSFTWGSKKERNVYGVPCVKVGSTDLDIIERIQSLLGGNIRIDKRTKDWYKDQYRLQWQGERAVEIMKLVSPHMGKRRGYTISGHIKHWSERPWLLEGSKNRHAKLNAEQVREIRERHDSKGESLRSLAIDYGVTKGNINHIIQRKTWRHI